MTTHPMTRYLLVCFLLVTFGNIMGCTTAKGPLFVPATAPEAANTLLYVYRKNLGHFQSAYTPNVYIDDKPFVKLLREGYCYTYLIPGNHTITFKHVFLAGHPKVDLPIFMEANKTYFVRVSDPIEPGALTTDYISRIQIVSNERGLAEISSTRLLVQEDISGTK